jgi:hypothetical protein
MDMATMDNGNGNDGQWQWIVMGNGQGWTMMDKGQRTGQEREFTNRLLCQLALHVHMLCLYDAPLEGIVDYDDY